MPGEVNGLKHGAEWTRMTERAVRCGWLDQAARESLQVLSSAGGIRTGERLADMEPLINIHVAKQAIASPGLDLVFWRKIEKGVFW